MTPPIIVLVFGGLLSLAACGDVVTDYHDHYIAIKCSDVDKDLTVMKDRRRMVITCEYPGTDGGK